MEGLVLVLGGLEEAPGSNEVNMDATTPLPLFLFTPVLPFPLPAAGSLEGGGIVSNPISPSGSDPIDSLGNMGTPSSPTITPVSVPIGGASLLATPPHPHPHHH